jgi:hypothetical protein
MGILPVGDHVLMVVAVVVVMIWLVLVLKERAWVFPNVSRLPVS